MLKDPRQVAGVLTVAFSHTPSTDENDTKPLPISIENIVENYPVIARHFFDLPKEIEVST